MPCRVPRPTAASAASAYSEPPRLISPLPPAAVSDRDAYRDKEIVHSRNLQGSTRFLVHRCPELNTEREGHTLALPRGRAARVRVQVHAVPRIEALS